MRVSSGRGVFAEGGEKRPEIRGARPRRVVDAAHVELLVSICDQVPGASGFDQASRQFRFKDARRGEPPKRVGISRRRPCPEGHRGADGEVDDDLGRLPEVQDDRIGSRCRSTARIRSARTLRSNELIVPVWRRLAAPARRWVSALVRDRTRCESLPGEKHRRCRARSRGRGCRRVPPGAG